MADRDNNVYLAKLAEQAERYDGESCGDGIMLVPPKDPYPRGLVE